MKIPFPSVLIRAGKIWRSKDGGLVAAATAYYAALSFFPLLMLLLAGVGLAMRFSSAAQDREAELLDLLSQSASPWLAEQVGRLLDEVQLQATVSGPVALMTLLATAIGVFAQLENIFNRIWDLPASPHKGLWAAVRTALIDRLRAFLMLLGLGFLLVVVFVTGLAMTAIRPWAVALPAGQTAWQLMQLTATVTINTLLMGALYRSLPRAEVRWTSALGGGLAAAVIWEIGQQALTSLLIGPRYNAYGVVGSFIALLLWVYYGAAVLFMGAALVKAMQTGPETAPPRTD